MAPEAKGFPLGKSLARILEGDFFLAISGARTLLSGISLDWELWGQRGEGAVRGQWGAPRSSQPPASVTGRAVTAKRDPPSSWSGSSRTVPSRLVTKTCPCVFAKRGRCPASVSSDLSSAFGSLWVCSAECSVTVINGWRRPVCLRRELEGVVIVKVISTPAHDGSLKKSTRHLPVPSHNQTKV